MANSQQPEESLQNNSQVSDAKTKLLHELIDFSRVLQQERSERDIEALIEKINGLVKPLLNSLNAPEATAITDSQVAWNEVLTQKLINANVNLADETVKEFTSQQVIKMSDRIDNLIEEFVCNISTLKRSDDKVTVVFQPSDWSLHGEQFFENIKLRGLTFNFLNYYSFGLVVFCKGIPPGKSCRVRITATMKNQAGQSDYSRVFSKGFSQKSLRLDVSTLFEKEEYEDKSLGFIRNEKLKIELAIQADELVDFIEEQSPSVPLKRKLPEPVPNGNCQVPVKKRGRPRAK